MEHLLVQRLVAVLGAHGKEDVAPDEFVHHLAVGREAAEDDLLAVAKLDHHVLCFPVDVPCLIKEKRNVQYNDLIL